MRCYSSFRTTGTRHPVYLVLDGYRFTLYRTRSSIAARDIFAMFSNFGSREGGLIRPVVTGAVE